MTSEIPKFTGEKYVGQCNSVLIMTHQPTSAHLFGFVDFVFDSFLWCSTLLGFILSILPGWGPVSLYRDREGPFEFILSFPSHWTPKILEEEKTLWITNKVRY